MVRRDITHMLLISGHEDDKYASNYHGEEREGLLGEKKGVFSI